MLLLTKISQTCYTKELHWMNLSYKADSQFELY
jgi:hypothetical protein